MKRVLLCLSLPILLAGCANATKDREQMAECAAYLQIVAGSDLYSQMQATNPDVASRVMAVGQAGGMYAQQITEPAKLQAIIQRGMTRGQRDVGARDVRAATNMTRQCAHTLDRLAR